MVKSPTTVTLVKQWVQLQASLLHKYGSAVTQNGLVTMVTTLNPLKSKADW
jgi:hypothetical protein